MRHVSALLLGAVLGSQVSLPLPFASDQNGTGISAPWSLLAIAHAQEAPKSNYTCPMHPQIHRDGPGQCPICGMELVAVTAGPAQTHDPSMPDATAGAAPHASRKVLYWYDPMVPDKRFDKPGKSPFMDMDLQPKYADDIAAPLTADAKPVLHIDAGTVQKMGVRTEAVLRRDLAQPLRAPGLVMANERARRMLSAQDASESGGCEYRAERVRRWPEREFGQSLLDADHALAAQLSLQRPVLALGRLGHLLEVQKDVAAVGPQLHVQSVRRQVAVSAQVLQAGDLIAEDREPAVVRSELQRIHE